MTVDLCRIYLWRWKISILGLISVLHIVGHLQRMLYHCSCQRLSAIFTLENILVSLLLLNLLFVQYVSMVSLASHRNSSSIGLFCELLDLKFCSFLFHAYSFSHATNDSFCRSNIIYYHHPID